MSNKYYYAVGRRKESTAIVKLFPSGKGNINIKKANGKTETLEQYFGGNAHMIQSALMPFDVLGPDYRKQFDIEIKIVGGGLAGQADAIKLGISRSLVLRNPDIKVTIKPYSLLKRDSRIKERKKPGLLKARKRPKRSKR